MHGGTNGKVNKRGNGTCDTSSKGMIEYWIKNWCYQESSISATLNAYRFTKRKMLAQKNWRHLLGINNMNLLMLSQIQIWLWGKLVRICDTDMLRGHSLWGLGIVILLWQRCFGVSQCQRLDLSPLFFASVFCCITEHVPHLRVLVHIHWMEMALFQNVTHYKQPWKLWDRY